MKVKQRGKEKELFGCVMWRERESKEGWEESCLDMMEKKRLKIKRTGN